MFYELTVLSSICYKKKNSETKLYLKLDKMLKILGIDFKRINKNIIPCITHYVAYINFHYFKLNTFIKSYIHCKQIIIMLLILHYT